MRQWVALTAHIVRQFETSPGGKMSDATKGRAASNERCKWSRLFAALGAAGIAVAAYTRIASATIVTFQDHAQPTASFQSVAAYLRNDKATNNFGGDPQVVAGTLGGSTGRVRAVFAYDLRTAGAVPPGSTITDVSFALTVATADGAASASRNVTLEMHPLTGTMTEGIGTSVPATSTSGVSWNNRATSTPWTAAGGDFSATVLASVTADPASISESTILTFTGSGTSNPLVQAAQAALDNPTSGVFEFLIKIPSGTSPGQEQGTSRELFIFHSDDNLNNGGSFDPSVSPILQITETPEPASVAVLLPAVAGGLLLRRRRPGSRRGRG